MHQLNEAIMTELDSSVIQLVILQGIAWPGRQFLEQWIMQSPKGSIISCVARSTIWQAMKLGKPKM
jgi:hypothetical protein